LYNTLRLSFPSANNKSDKKDPTSPARTGDARCNFSIHLFTSNGLFGEESKPRYLEEKFSAVNVTTREGSGDTTCFRRFETIYYHSSGMYVETITLSVKGSWPEGPSSVRMRSLVWRQSHWAGTATLG